MKHYRVDGRIPSTSTYATKVEGMEVLKSQARFGWAVLYQGNYSTTKDGWIRSHGREFRIAELEGRDLD